MAPLLLKFQETNGCRIWSSRWRPGSQLFDGFCKTQTRRLEKRATPDHHICTTTHGITTCINLDPKKSSIDLLREAGRKVCGDSNGTSACVGVDPKPSVDTYVLREEQDAGGKKNLTDTSKPIRTIEIVRPIETTNTIQSSKTTGAIETMKVVEVIKPTETIKSIRAVEVINPVKTTAVTKPIIVVETSKPTTTVEMVQPVKTIEAVKPSVISNNIDRIVSLSSPNKITDSGKVVGDTVIGTVKVLTPGKTDPSGQLICTQEKGATNCIDVALKKFVDDELQAATNQESSKAKTAIHNMGLGQKRMTKRIIKDSDTTMFEQDYQKNMMENIHSSLSDFRRGPGSNLRAPHTKDGSSFNSSTLHLSRPQIHAQSSTLPNVYSLGGLTTNSVNESVQDPSLHQSATTTLMAVLGLLVFVLLMIRGIFYLFGPPTKGNNNEIREDIELGLLESDGKQAFTRAQNFEGTSIKASNEQANRGLSRKSLPKKNKLGKKPTTPRFLTRRMNVMETT